MADTLDLTVEPGMQYISLHDPWGSSIYLCTGGLRRPLSRHEQRHTFLVTISRPEISKKFSTRVVRTYLWSGLPQIRALNQLNFSLTKPNPL